VLVTIAGQRRRRVLGVVAAVIGAVVGLPGTVLFLMATATDHHVTFWNENLLVLNPLPLLLVPAGLALAWSSSPAPRAARVVVAVLSAVVVGGGVAVVGKVLPGFDQQNAPVLAVVLPPLLSLWLCRRTLAS